MKLVPFQMERWQSTWEHRVEFNLSESGVEPLPLRELLRDEAAVDRFLNHPLAYSQGNGTPELRSSIASLYPGTTPDHVLVTNGSSEACLLALWHLVEPGDEVVLLLPNYMEGWGLIQMFGGKVRPLWLREDLGWQFDPAELATLVNRRTKAIAVCNPNNPTGAVMAEAQRRAVLDAARDAELWPPERMDRGPWPAVHAHPSRRGRHLFLAIRIAHQFLGSGVAPAEREVDADCARRPVRHGRVHPDRDGTRGTVPLRRTRPDRWRPACPGRGERRAVRGRGRSCDALSDPPRRFRQRRPGVCATPPGTSVGTREDPWPRCRRRRDRHRTAWVRGTRTGDRLEEGAATRGRGRLPGVLWPRGPRTVGRVHPPRPGRRRDRDHALADRPAADRRGPHRRGPLGWQACDHREQRPGCLPLPTPQRVGPNAGTRLPIRGDRDGRRPGVQPVSRDAPRHPNPVVRGDPEQHDEPGPLHDGGGPDVRGRSQVGAAHGPPRDGAGDGPRGLGRDREGVSPGQRLDGRPSPPGTGAAGGDRLRVVETDRGGEVGTQTHEAHRSRMEGWSVREGLRILGSPRARTPARLRGRHVDLPRRADGHAEGVADHRAPTDVATDRLRAVLRPPRDPRGPSLSLRHSYIVSTGWSAKCASSSAGRSTSCTRGMRPCSVPPSTAGRRPSSSASRRIGSRRNPEPG